MYFAHTYVDVADSYIADKDISFIVPNVNCQGVIKLVDRFVFNATALGSVLYVYIAEDRSEAYLFIDEDYDGEFGASDSLLDTVTLHEE